MKKIIFVILIVIILLAFVYILNINNIVRDNLLLTNKLDNTIIVCEDNGLCDFPFVLGGKAYLLSIPDGEKYYIEDKIGMMKGIVEPYRSGNLVLWFEGWDGSSTGVSNVTNLSDKNADYILPEYIYTNSYYLSGEYLYIGAEDEEGERISNVSKWNLHTGKSETVIDITIDYFKVLDDKILYFDKKNNIICLDNEGYNILLNDDIVNVIKHKDCLYIQTAESGIKQYNIRQAELMDVVGNGDFEDVVDNQNTMNIHNDNLYYSDEDGNVMMISADNEIITILSSAEIYKFVGIKEGDIDIRWTNDHIVTFVTGYGANSSKMQGYVIAYDYNGKIQYQKHNNRIVSIN